MTSDLLPCPFCGGEPELIEGPPGCVFVLCTVCRASSDDRARDATIAAWNRSDYLMSGDESRRLIRNIRGDLSQTQFAERVGISRSALANYETGRTVPKKAILRKIVSAGSADHSWRQP